MWIKYINCTQAESYKYLFIRQIFWKGEETVFSSNLKDKNKIILKISSKSESSRIHLLV